MSIVVRNWRDQEPYVGHISAVVWTLYQSHDKDETSPPDVNRLHGINSFVKHGLQGHQHSDHHQHTDIEQMYFVLRGRGQLTIGDDKVDVRDGTAVYMPVHVPHQAFNDSDGWMEHLIVSCPLDEIREGTPAVCDWRDVHPIVLEGGTISWPLLQREEDADASEGGVLQRVHSVTRYAVQGRQGSAWQQLDSIELVHYVLGGYGTIEDQDGNRHLVTEGSAAHVLPGAAHQFVNQGEGWLEYVTFAVEVGEIEEQRETDTDSDTEDEQSGVEEAAATIVIAEVDWDEADAVETEEEIEEAVAADAVDPDDEAESADEMEEETDTDEAELDAEAEDVGDEDGEEAEDGDGDDEDGEEAEDGDDEEDEGEEAENGGDEEDEGEEAVDDEDDEAEEESDEESNEESDVTEEESGETDAADDESEDLDADEEPSADEDEIDLDDDDADFDIEDEDETTVEDETGEEDDSLDPYKR